MGFKYLNILKKKPFLTPSLLQPVKLPGWKIDGCACRQYIFWSYNIYFHCYVFWWKIFHMPALKKRQNGLILHICGSFSNDIMASSFFFFNKLWIKPPLNLEEFFWKAMTHNTDYMQPRERKTARVVCSKISDPSTVLRSYSCKTSRAWYCRWVSVKTRRKRK